MASRAADIVALGFEEGYKKGCSDTEEKQRVNVDKVLRELEKLLNRNERGEMFTEMGRAQAFRYSIDIVQKYLK